MIIKEWSLDFSVVPLTEIDRIFLLGLGCEFQIKKPEPVEFMISGGTYHYAPLEKTEFIIVTTCSKQETMLKLKYGNNLYLKYAHYEDINMAPYRR